MDTYKVNFLKYKQDCVTMYLLTMSADELIGIAQIERFSSSDDTGYQRQPIPAHYKRISKYLMQKEPAPILPTAILASVSPVHIEEIDNDLYIYDKIRIVDGQHRIKGLEALKDGYTKDGKERYEELNNTYRFPIILMVLSPPENTKHKIPLLEVDAFININNKGKRVSTDLAKQLSAQIHNRTVLECSEGAKLDNTAIANEATNIVEQLTKNENNFWFDKIILGDVIDKQKPISITAFAKAITPIVQIRLQTMQAKGIVKAEDLSQERDRICQLINRAWKIVIAKWPDCFIDEFTHNDRYNICKGIGVFPIYGLLGECLKDIPSDIDLALNTFRGIISRSTVVSSDWLTGGRFTGMSSGQAIKQLIRIIKNTDGDEQN